MRSYKGVVRAGNVVLAEGVYLPEGTVVTVTIGEAELLRASLRSALRRSAHRRRCGRMLRPAFAGIGGDMA